MSIKNKARLYTIVRNVGLVLLGSFILALADALFIMPCSIINGGIDSIGVIVNFYLKDVVGFDLSDIVIASLQIILWIVGLLLLGKKFSFYTLLGTLAFPAFYSILLRINIIELIGLNKFYLSHTVDGNLDFLTLIIAGLIGGVLSGGGIALTFLGNGSTGGTDILSFLIAKYTSIKQDLSGLILDTSMIVIGFICLRNFELFFAGIISAVVTAYVVKKIYIQSDAPVVMDIICNDHDTVSNFIHEKLDHATTLIQVEGGYSKKKRMCVRAIVYGTETTDVKAFISSVDPNAFISVIPADNVSGEGFEALRFSPRSLKRILHYYGIKTKDDLHKEKLNK